MTQEDALTWIAEIFEEPPENVRESSTRDEIAGWDSLGVLTLMASLDERFDIRLTEQELGELQCVGDILALLERHDVFARS